MPTRLTLRLVCLTRVWQILYGFWYASNEHQQYILYCCTHDMWSIHRTTHANRFLHKYLSVWSDCYIRYSFFFYFIQITSLTSVIDIKICIHIIPYIFKTTRGQIFSFSFSVSVVFFLCFPKATVMLMMMMMMMTMTTAIDDVNIIAVNPLFESYTNHVAIVFNSVNKKSTKIAFIFSAYIISKPGHTAGLTRSINKSRLSAIGIAS